jgi:hypothetical protein
MLRQAFIALLAGLATSVSRDEIGFFDRFVQSSCCIGRFVRIAKIQSQLIRIVDVPLAVVPKTLLQQLVVRKLQALVVLRQLFKLLLSLLTLDVSAAEFDSLRLEFDSLRLEFDSLRLERNVTFLQQLKQLSLGKSGSVIHAFEDKDSPMASKTTWRLSAKKNKHSHTDVRECLLVESKLNTGGQAACSLRFSE